METLRCGDKFVAKKVFFVDGKMIEGTAVYDFIKLTNQNLLKCRLNGHTYFLETNRFVKVFARREDIGRDAK